MATPKAVPSRAAIHALRGLLFTTSCSVVVLAEERRRRLKLVRTAAENARKIHAAKRTRGAVPFGELQPWEASLIKRSQEATYDADSPSPRHHLRNRRERRRKRRPRGHPGARDDNAPASSQPLSSASAFSSRFLDTFDRRRPSHTWLLPSWQEHAAYARRQGRAPLEAQSLHAPKDTSRELHTKLRTGSGNGSRLPLKQGCTLSSTRKTVSGPHASVLMDLPVRILRRPGGVRQIHTTSPVGHKSTEGASGGTGSSNGIIQPSDFLARFSSQDRSQDEKWSSKPKTPADPKSGIVNPEEFSAKFAQQDLSQGEDWSSKPKTPAGSKSGIVDPEEFSAKFAQHGALQGEDWSNKPKTAVNSKSGIVDPQEFSAKFARQKPSQDENWSSKPTTVTDGNGPSKFETVESPELGDRSLQPDAPQDVEGAPRQRSPLTGPIKSLFVRNRLRDPKPIQYHPIVPPRGEPLDVSRDSYRQDESPVAKPFGFALSHDHDYLASRRQSFRQLPENEGWRRGKGYMPQLSDKLREAKNLLEVKPTERSRLLLMDRMVYPGVGTSASRSGSVENAKSNSTHKWSAEGPLGRLGTDMATDYTSLEAKSSTQEMIRQTLSLTEATPLQRFELGEVYADHFNKKQPGLSRTQVENYRMEGCYVVTQLLTSILASHESLLLPKVAEVLSKLRESGMDPTSAVLMEPKRRASDVLDVCITGKLPISFFEEVLLTLVHPEEDWLGIIPSFLRKVKAKPTDHTMRLTESMFRSFAQPHWSSVWRSGQLVSDFVDFWADSAEASEKLADLLTNRRFGRSLNVAVEVEQRLQSNLTFLRGLGVPDKGMKQAQPDVYECHIQALREARAEDWDAVWATLAQGLTAGGDRSEDKCAVVDQQIADLLVASHSAEEVAESLPRLRELTAFELRSEWVHSVLDLYGRQLSAKGYFAWLDFCSSSKFTADASFVHAMCKNLGTYWLASPKAIEDLRLSVEPFMPPDRRMALSGTEGYGLRNLRRKRKAEMWTEAIEIFQNSIPKLLSIDAVTNPFYDKYLHNNLYEIVEVYLSYEGPDSEALHHLLDRFAAKGHDMSSYCTRVALEKVSSGCDPKMARDLFANRGLKLGAAFYNTVVQGLINDSSTSKALGWCMLWASDYGKETMAHDGLSFLCTTRALTVMDTKAAYLELDRILTEFVREPQWWHASDAVYYSIKRNIRTVARRVEEKDPWQEAMLVRLDQGLVEASKRRYTRRRDRPTIIRKFVDYVLCNPPDWPDEVRLPPRPAAKAEAAASRKTLPRNHDTGYISRILSDTQVGVSG